MECTFREATSEDCELLMSLIQEIASFHHILEDVKINSQELKEDGFGKHPFFKCILAEVPGEPGSQAVRTAGYALYFFGYNVNHGRLMYLENLYVVSEFRVCVDVAREQSKLTPYDLFVGFRTHPVVCYDDRPDEEKELEEEEYKKPAARGKGIGKQLLRKVAEIALNAGCVEIKFTTMEGNHLAREFWVRSGACDTTESERWHCMVLEQEELQKLVQG